MSATMIDGQQRIIDAKGVRRLVDAAGQRLDNQKTNPTRAKGANGRLVANISAADMYKAAVALGLKNRVSRGRFALTEFERLGGTQEELERIKAKAQPGIAGKADLIEPETKETSDYWQLYAATKQDLDYKAEQKRKKSEDVAPLRGEGYDPRKHHPADPSDPDAYVPAWVRFAKRKLVNFKCPVTGWRETDWIQPLNGGRTRLVGELTLDHRLARAKNGRTTDDNTRMVASLANSKKGDRDLSDEQIRANLANGYKIVEPPTDLLPMLQKYGIKEYR